MRHFISSIALRAFATPIGAYSSRSYAISDKGLSVGEADAKEPSKENIDGDVALKDDGAYDHREAILQEAHDTCHALVAIMRRRPIEVTLSGGGNQMFGNPEAYRNEDTVGLRRFAPLAELYHEQYRKMSDLISHELIEDLDASIPMVKDDGEYRDVPGGCTARRQPKEPMVGGIPRRKQQAAFHISKMHVHTPADISVLKGDIEAPKHHAVKLARALRNQKTYKDLVYIIEHEWPQSGGLGCVPLHKKLYDAGLKGYIYTGSI